jgi:hypothetical protein
MSIKSITLTAAIVAVALALPGAALGAPIDGPSAPAYLVQNQGDAEQTAPVDVPHGVAYNVQNQGDAGQTAPTPVAAASDSGFEWGDAGIGAGSMLALGGIAVGGYVLLRNRGRAPELHPSGS